MNQDHLVDKQEWLGFWTNVNNLNVAEEEILDELECILNKEQLQISDEITEKWIALAKKQKHHWLNDSRFS